MRPKAPLSAKIVTLIAFSVLYLPLLALVVYSFAAVGPEGLDPGVVPKGPLQPSGARCV